MIWKFTIKHILSRPFSAVLTLVALIVALSFLGGFWTLVENLERVRFSKSATVTSENVSGLTVFMDPKLQKSEIETFRNKILEDKRFAKAEVVSSDEAVKALQAQFGEALSKAFEKDTLPITLKLEFAQGSISRPDFLNLMNEIRQMPGVQDVDDGMSLLSAPTVEMTKTVFTWANLLLLLVFVVVALLVSHLIRLAFETHRPEIETLKIIGASKTWIFAPLFLEGLLFGVLGSVISLLLVRGLTLILISKDPFSSGLESLSLAGMSALSLKSSINLALLGVVAAVSGALLTWPLIDQAPQE
jgi:cell division transport system permease protein